MAIEVTLDIMLATRKVKSKDLAAHVGITDANLSLLKSGKVKGVKFETLSRICDYLECDAGDILRHVPDDVEADGEAIQTAPVPPPASVVEDDPGIATMLECFLKAEGHVVHCATEVGRGVELARRHRPDVALVDLMMPDDKNSPSM